MASVNRTTGPCKDEPLEFRELGVFKYFQKTKTVDALIGLRMVYAILVGEVNGKVENKTWLIVEHSLELLFVKYATLNYLEQWVLRNVPRKR